MADLLHPQALAQLLRVAAWNSFIALGVRFQSELCLVGIPPLPVVPCCDSCPLSIAKNSVTSRGRALLVTAGQYILPGLARSTYHGHLSYVFN